MDFIIDFTLVGIGWANCKVSRGDSACEITASYLTDALGNLLLCAYGSISGFSRAAFGFDEEPGEFRWVVQSVATNEISISILAFAELWGNVPDSEGRVLFFTRCAPLEFAEAALAAAQVVLSRYGLDRYNASWGSAFPSIQLGLLRDAVEMQR